VPRLSARLSASPPAFLLPPRPSRNLPQTLAAAQAAGWLVLGAAAEPGAARASQFTLDRPAVLVMGNEGYGLRTTVRRLCDSMLQARGGGACSGGGGRQQRQLPASCCCLARA
jgi:tRNA G18 (ribose-2'-O)-methylase SpoU